MKKLQIAVVLLLFFSCSETVEKKHLQHLSGYWEIEKVMLPNGNTKQYTINQTIDHITLNPDSTGFRKKVQPQLNCTFLITGHAEYFKISFTQDTLKIQHNTTLDQWEETIVSIKKNQLVMKNKNNLMYFYKRFQSVNLNQ